MERALATMSVGAPPQPQPVAQPQAGGGTFNFTADPISDPDGFRREMMQAQHQSMQQAMGAYAQPMLASQARLARDASARNAKYAEVWQKYGTEIDSLMANVAVDQKIYPEVWDSVAEIVRGRHVDEIAEARAQRILAERGSAPLSERAGNFAPGAQPAGAWGADELEKLWNEDGAYVRALKEAGTTKAYLYEAARRMGYAPDEYAKHLRSSQALHGGPPRAFHNATRPPSDAVAA